jgi:hypothetical protein
MIATDMKKNLNGKRLRFRRVHMGSILATILAALNTGAVPSVIPTGTTIYDPKKAYNSYVLFSGADEKTHLIDLDGNEVHRWNHDGFPSVLIDPELADGKKGHVLLQLEKISGNATSVSPGAPANAQNKTVGELDWDGNTVWSWGDKAPDGAARQHHDIRRLPNGDTLLLVNRLHPVDGFTLPQVLDDGIYEVTPEGKIAWQWLASEHLEEFGLSEEGLKELRNVKQPDFFHFNDLAPVGQNKWFDAGDQRFNPENFIADSRNANFIVIIEKKTGKIVWRLGPDYPPYFENRKVVLPVPVDQISGQHDAHIIPKGLPGEGNLLVFDNQGEGGYPSARLGITSGSRVLEIDPVKKQIVWEYTGDLSGSPAWTFYSSFISSARRLPNGNTLIDEGRTGRFFQVTPAGEIVWEYVSPYFGRARAGGAGHEIFSNWVYRAQPVPYNWVPDGTPHEEKAVVPPAAESYRVLGSR